MKITITTETIEEIKKLFGSRAGRKILDVIEDKSFLFSTIADEITLSKEDFVPSKKEKVIVQNLEEIRSIVDHLNKYTGRSFRADNKSTVSLISSLFKMGYNSDQIKAVIDWKVIDWKGSSFEAYLRPQTLFGPKFEGYLMESQALPDEKKLSDKLDGLFEN